MLRCAKNAASCGKFEYIEALGAVPALTLFDAVSTLPAHDAAINLLEISRN
jgi:hypothetical protein